MTRQLVVELLGAEHDRTTFSSGYEALDRYLREQAGQDLRRQLSTIFVLREAEDRTLLGFYTLSACEVRPTALPPHLAKRLPRRPLPATLIGRLAIDLRCQGQGLGGILLANALLRAAIGSKDIGSMLIVVDAKDDRARGFYERYGFERFRDDPYRLFLPMADAMRIAQVAGKVEPAS